MVDTDPFFAPESEFELSNSNDPISGIQETPINEFQHPRIIATASQLGHVKGGGNVTIDPDGTLRAPAPVNPTWENIEDKPNSFTPSAHSHGTYYTKTLTVVGWVDKKQTVPVVGLTDDNKVYVSPSELRSNFLAYGSANISVAQSDDSLVFECSIVPVVELTVNIEVV